MNTALTLQIGGDLSQLRSELAKATGLMNGFSSNLKNIGAQLGLTFGAAGIGMIIRDGVKVMAEFERVMSEVKAITGTTGKEFEQMENDALRLGASTKYTAEQVGQLQIAYGRLGFTTREILAATEATLDLAAATGEDLAKSADVAGSTVRGFQLNAAETQRVVDVMASSFNKTALGLDNFTESMKYVAPVANAAGATVEEATALLGTLADAGIRGSMAGTSLRKIFTDLTKDGRPLKERLAELAAKGITLADSFDEVGRTAQTSLLILSKNTDKTDALTSAFQNVTGEAAKMARVMRDNLIGDVEKLSSAWEALILKLSNSSVIRQITQDLTEMLNMLSGNPDISRALDELAKGFSDGHSQAGIDDFINDIKEMRRELGKPIDLNIVQELAEKYKMTDAQANKFYTTVVDINRSLSFQEVAIKQFNQFVESNGYEDLAKAAHDYKDSLYNLMMQEQIRAAEIEKYVPGAEKDIQLAKDKVTEYRRVINVLNEYVKAQEKVTTTIAETNKLAELQKVIKFRVPKVTPPPDEIFGSFDELDASRSGMIPELPTDNEMYKETIELLGLMGGEYQDINAQIEEYNKKQKEAQEQMQHTMQVAAGLGTIIGNAFDEAISGQRSFLSALKSIVPQVIKMLLTEALAHIMAAGAKQGAKSGNAIVGVLAAGAGAAAISAMFSRYVNASSSSSGDSQGTTPSKYYGDERMSVSVGGRIRGYDLDLVAEKEDYRKNRVG